MAVVASWRLGGGGTFSGAGAGVFGLVSAALRGAAFFGWGRPCHHAVRVPAVRGVRVGCASDSVLRQSADLPVVQQRRVPTHGANSAQDRRDPTGAVLGLSSVNMQRQVLAGLQRGANCAENLRDSTVARVWWLTFL